MTEPFKAAHLAEIDLQPAQGAARRHFPQGYGELLEASGPALTVRHAGRIQACFGIGRPTPDERLLWCFCAAHISPWRVFAAVRTFLVEHRHEPLYATAAEGFAPGARSLELLGFTPIDRLAAFDFDGRDHTLFTKAAA